MKKIARGVTYIGLFALTVMTAFIAPSAEAAGRMAVTFTITSQWQTGHVVQVTITNGTSAKIPLWRMEFNTPEKNKITEIWGAKVTRSGPYYIATQNTKNTPIKPGQSRSWEYSSTGTFQTPNHCLVNGLTCQTRTKNKPPATETNPPSAGASKKTVAYLPSWSVYSHDYHVKNIETSGSSSKLTHLIYAFGNVVNGACVNGDKYADYEKMYTAATSVNGIADAAGTNTPHGNFGQLLRLKAMHPQLKVMWSFGGASWSGGFTQAAANPTAFAESCYQLVNNSQWAGLFDGIDIDWEFPNSCAETCDGSSYYALTKMLQALRSRFGSTAVITAAITPDSRAGGIMDANDYGGAAQYASWLMPMTYGYAGSWNKTGPTGLHMPLYSYPGIQYPGVHIDATVQKLIGKGVPRDKIVLGVDAYGRGWSGVSQKTPGGTATGLAPGSTSPGIDDYNSLRTRCPATQRIGGGSYATCGNEWWSYDTPESIAEKMRYVNTNNLGGAFLWEISGDSPKGNLMAAIANGLQ